MFYINCKGLPRPACRNLHSSRHVTHQHQSIRSPALHRNTYTITSQEKTTLLQAPASGMPRQNFLLARAINRNDSEAVQQVLKDGADVNDFYHPDVEFKTPLALACHRGHDRIVRMLLDAGADAQWKNFLGSTAAHIACSDGHFTVLQMLITHGALLENENNLGWTPLFEACRSGHTEICRFLVECGCNVHATDRLRNTILMLAAQSGNLEVVRFLKERGCNVHATNRNGETTLMMAAQGGRREVVRFLLDCGCNVHATDYFGRNALKFATVDGCPDTVRLLLAAGVNVDACDHDNQTALHDAARFRKLDVLRELLLYNANMFPVDVRGKTPFDCAENKEEVQDLLIQMYSSRLSRENEGQLALHTLLGNAEYSFDRFERDGDWGHPPLHPLRVKLQLGSLKWKHLRTLFLSVDEELLRRRDDNGKLPIHIACQTNAPLDVLVALVERDPATLHMADHAGELPLHKYCRCCCDTTDLASALRFLVDRGGVGTLAGRNQEGALPLHVLLCGASTTTASLHLLVIRFLILGFPGALSVPTNAGLYPFMIAASNSSFELMSVVYEMIRANPSLAMPR